MSKFMGYYSNFEKNLGSVYENENCFGKKELRKASVSLIITRRGFTTVES